MPTQRTTPSTMEAPAARNFNSKNEEFAPGGPLSGRRHMRDADWMETWSDHW